MTRNKGTKAAHFIQAMHADLKKPVSGKPCRFNGSMQPPSRHSIWQAFQDVNLLGLQFAFALADCLFFAFDLALEILDLGVRPVLRRPIDTTRLIGSCLETVEAR